MNMLLIQLIKYKKQLVHDGEDNKYSREKIFFRLYSFNQSLLNVAALYAEHCSYGSEDRSDELEQPPPLVVSIRLHLFDFIKFS